MNKKVLIIFLLVLFVPTIIAAVWFLSVSGKTYTPSNVASVSLKSPDGEVWKYTEEGEKEFFTTLATNLVSIEEQVFSSDIWTLYELSFERTFDSSVYYLCLSPNAKNCLAYDNEGNWYRINTEDARAFLVRSELEGIYTNNSYPEFSLVASGKSCTIPARHYEWSYLLADGTFSSMENTSDEVFKTDITVLASESFTFSFPLEADWCDVKIFDENTLVFSGDLNNLKTFSYDKDSTLKALVSCEWYKDDSKLYYGNTISEFYFNYDVKASAKTDKTQYTPGEIIYVELLNSANDVFDVSTSLMTAKTPIQRTFENKSYVMLPIAAENKTGEYPITLKSDNTTISLNVYVGERAIEDAVISISDVSFSEYDEALQNILEELELETYVSPLTEPLWKDGLVTPVKKFEKESELYWISAPVYGAAQIVNGTKISSLNLGAHYIKSVDLDALLARAVSDAVVAFSGTTKAYGNTIVLDHGFGFFTVYGHLEECNFQKGESVIKGSIVGKSADSGIIIKDGELFFAVIQDGVFVNPYTIIVEQKKPTDSETFSGPDIF